jgi:hypothetical protein
MAVVLNKATKENKDDFSRKKIANWTIHIFLRQNKKETFIRKG